MKAWIFALATCGLAWVNGARAQSASTIAEALFEQGRAAVRAGDYDTACARFRESNRLDPAAGTLFNLASCEEERHQLATAWELYRATIEQLPSGDSRIELARQHLSALEPKLPHLTIRLAPGAPPNTVVTRGSLELQGASLGVPLPVDPGKHELRVSAPGHGQRSYSLELREGQALELEVQPGDTGTSDPASPGALASAPATPHEAESASSGRTAGYWIGGVGVAALGVGAVTGLLTLSSKSTVNEHCSSARALCDSEGRSAEQRGRTLGTLSGATLIGGGVALALGSYLVLSSSAAPKRAGAARLVVGWRAGGAEFGAVGAW